MAAMRTGIACSATAITVTGTAADPRALVGSLAREPVARWVTSAAAASTTTATAMNHERRRPRRLSEGTEDPAIRGEPTPPRRHAGLQLCKECGPRSGRA